MAFEKLFLELDEEAQNNDSEGNNIEHILDSLLILHHYFIQF